MNVLRYILLALVFATTLCMTAEAQYTPSLERGDPLYRRGTNIDGNELRATIFNFCFTGREGVIPGQIPYEYPKNTGRDYVALNAMFFGAQVVLDDDSTVAEICDVPDFRTSPAGATWNLEPVPGYYNYKTGLIAKSDDPTTWPSSWPDKQSDPLDQGWKGEWDGYFGKNIFNADQELYYKASDDRYNRYTYTPDSTDRQRRGLGLIVDSRAMEWSQILINDAVFLIYNVQNDGTKDISKFGMTIWFADLVGGDADAQSDWAFYDLRNQAAWSVANNAVREQTVAFFNKTLVGAVLTSYLETPGNSVDRIDNDGDGEPGGPQITEAMLAGENPLNGVDDNGNGLIDESVVDIQFGSSGFKQKPVTFADGIDNNGNGEAGSPVVTQDMIDEAATDTVIRGGQTYHWYRWPPNPQLDPMQANIVPGGPPIIHLIDVVPADLGFAFKDNIDNNGNAIRQLPKVTQAMIDMAATDKYHRYRVPGTNVILYSLDSSSLGKGYLFKDGMRDAGVDEGIDEMIDEARDDSVDNDHDWQLLTDDVGIDGKDDGAPGDRDGFPSSGAGTTFPGEPRIDKTDIKESDQLGITRVQYLPAGKINFSTTADIYFWATFMIPVTDSTQFYVPPTPISMITGDNDLFVGSGIFPMPSGHIERISEATCVGVGNPNDGNNGLTSDTATALLHMRYCLSAYQNNYQFAKAPLQPALHASVGDGRVTLYWDSTAESSPDPYLVSVGLLKPGQTTFEGYHIYRSTDPAFQDAYKVTNGEGSPDYYVPIATFDIPHDGVKGYDTSLAIHDSTGSSNILFYMGTDSLPLLHSWIDSNVQNGQTYYYEIRAFSKPHDAAGFPPAESIAPIALNQDGSVTLGKSVVKVVPEAPAAGFAQSKVPGGIEHVKGTSTGSVTYTIVDPTKVINNETYRLTFEDTTYLANEVAAPGSSDTLTTKDFTLAILKSRNPDILDTVLSRKRSFQDTVEQPLVNGLRLGFHNERLVGVNPSLSKWNDPSTYSFVFTVTQNSAFQGESNPANYLVIIDTVGVDTSVTVTLPSNLNGSLGSSPVPLKAKPVNYRVYNSSTHAFVKTGFLELDGKDGKFSISDTPRVKIDRIFFLEPNAQDSLVFTWTFNLMFDSSRRNPVPGDTATIILRKPFLIQDVYEFTTTGQHISTSAAANQMSNIKVVPNPYIVTNSWEPPSPFSNGEPPRTIHFNHLPSVCTIDIFTVGGGLVQTLHHSSAIIDGTESWDLITKDHLPAAYGIYVFHVNAPGVGELVGKFAVIK